ncbi:TSUP family transporter [Sulfitobacter sp. JB4-11]|uniref:TSUP family transporter n=1 Tax=Sulfitobacter rhodophyticola TaxID=3238304 RepID=UPI003516C3EB
MPDFIALAGTPTGLIWLVGAVFAAGLVRGFAGFGSAMIIMPVASSVLEPVQAVIFLVAAEVLGPLPNLPSALRVGALREVGLLLLGAAVALPLGLLCLANVDPRFFGWTVSVIVLVLLVLLMTGWRYAGVLTRPLVVGTGALGGFMTGFSGLPGPPVIMLYMASRLPAAVIRANFLLYLLAIDLVLMAVLWVSGLMVWPAFVLGLLVGVPNVIANWLGARLFDPQAERLFRNVAYIVIAASAILGLPLWKG